MPQSRRDAAAPETAHRPTPALALPDVATPAPPGGLGAALTPRAVLALQRQAGNSAVTRLLAQRPAPARPALARCACGGAIGADGLCDRCRRERAAAGQSALVQREPGPPAAVITDATQVTGATTGVLAAAALPAGERLCFPPGPIMGPQWGSGFGTLAERFIEQDYCATLGCSPATDYVDNYNPGAYLAFMRAHNPSLAGGAPAAALAVASVTGIARPDLLTDNGVRREYYEIKPFSPDGVSAGMEKLVEIMGFMAALSLPYVPGTTYSPSKDIPMWSGMVVGEPLGVALNVQRMLPGLVTYSLCLRGNLSAILAKVALAALLAWLIAEILAGAAVVVVAAAAA